MSSRARLKRGSRRQVSRLGVPVEIIDYERIESGTHGTRHEKTDESPRDVTAIPDPGGGGTYMADFGTDSSYDVAFLLRDDDAESINGSGSEEYASEILMDGHEFTVETTHLFHDNGVAVVGCSTGDEP